MGFLIIQLVDQIGIRDYSPIADQLFSDPIRNPNLMNLQSLFLYNSLVLLIACRVYLSWILIINHYIH